MEISAAKELYDARKFSNLGLVLSENNLAESLIETVVRLEKMMLFRSNQLKLHQYIIRIGKRIEKKYLKRWKSKRCA